MNGKGGRGEDCGLFFLPFSWAFDRYAFQSGIPLFGKLGDGGDSSLMLDWIAAAQRRIALLGMLWVGGWLLGRSYQMGSVDQLRVEFK